MSAETPAMLFAPPRPPFRVTPAREIVIGRAANCDLPVDSDRASRCHAAVRFHDGAYRLRDLGSTNGTLLNGVRLAEERSLSPGDRIGVGGVTVTFCRVDSSLADAVTARADDRTIVAAPGASVSSESLRGDFRQIPSFAVLQMLELGGQTGVLSIEGEDHPEQLWLEEGRPVHATAGDRSGLDAALAIVLRESGLFQFVPQEECSEETIEVTVTHLLLEASRLQDEESA